MCAASMRTFLLGLAILCAGCAPSRRAWRPEEAPAGVSIPAAYAVVSSATPLSIAPRRGAPAISRAIARDAYGLPLGPPGFTALRILGEDDGWARLETLGEPAGVHCADGIEGLEAFRLRVYAPVEALMLVTQREVAQSFSDGTRAELARGVPLEPLPSPEWYRVHAGEVTTVLRIGRPDVGTRYLPSAERPAAPPVNVVPASAGAILGQTGRVESTRDLPVYGAEPRGAESLVELRPRCARLVVRVPTHALGTAAGAIPEAPGGPPGDGVLVRAGTAVRWRDGSEAGVVTRDVRLSEVEGTGALRCFVPCEGCVEVCFDRRALREPGAGPSAILDAPG